MRTFKLPTVRSELALTRAPDLQRQWAGALAHVREPEQRLRAALSLALPLTNARRAIVFDEDRIVAGLPGTIDGSGLRRLFDRARRILDDELAGPKFYVARLAPDRPERLALSWQSATPGTVEVARAIAASCRYALDDHGAPASAPAGLPDLFDTLERLRQLIHDARRRGRPFAVIYVVVETPRPLTLPGARELVAERLRRDVRANDHLGFVGDDAYVVLLSLDAAESEAYPAAQRLLKAATAAAGAPANAGVATCPNDGEEAEDLIEKAGAAAVAAASSGDVQPSWYRESDGRAYGLRAWIRSQLRDGDPGALLDLRYAPIVDAKSGAMFAASAAAGWLRADLPAELAPQVWLGGESDGRALERLELWMVAQAAEAQSLWSGTNPNLPVFLALESRTDAAIDAIARGFGGGNGARKVFVELTGGPHPVPQDVESFARRLRSMGVRVGVGAWRTASPPFDLANGLLDFVTVDAGSDVRTLAGLAVASVTAPVVVAGGARDRDHAKWLLRNGATAVWGDGIAAPMTLNELVRWASDHPETVAQ